MKIVWPRYVRRHIVRARAVPTGVKPTRRVRKMRARILRMVAR